MRELADSCAFEEGVDDHVHGEVVDYDGLHDLHEELGLVWLGYRLPCLVFDRTALSYPKLEVDIDDLFGEGAEHGLHDAVYLTPD